jgi:hypothetical protein
MASAVVCDHAIASFEEEEHLGVPLSAERGQP